MKRWKLLLIAALFTLGIACAATLGGRGAESGGARLVFEGDSTELQKTVVVQTLDAPLPEGKSAVWSASFELAWRTLGRDVVGEPPAVAGAEELAARLNGSPLSERDLPDGAAYSAAGVVGDGVVDRIRREVRERFGREAALAEGLPAGAVVAYAYLETKVPFRIPYFEAPGEIFFGPLDSKVRVDGFGLRYEDMYGYRRLRDQVDVLEYEGGAEREEFIVDPCKTSDPVQVVLASIERGATLEAMVRTVEERIAGVAADAPERRLEDGEVFVVPNIFFDVTHRVAELEGKTITNGRLEGTPIASAVQSIRFKLDRSGAELRTEARIVPAALSRTLIFDRPFLVYLKLRRGGRPFFALWVENPELLATSGQ